MAGKEKTIVVAKEGQSILDATMDAINKLMGIGSIMYLGQEKALLRVEAIPTKSMALNIALGIGGAPRGRIMEIYGPEHSGKTGIALGIVSEAQALARILNTGKKSAYVDPECGLDIELAKLQGVDIDSLLYSQPASGEKALAIVEALVKTNMVDVAVVDSVAALVPQKELDGEMGDSHVGLQARLMSQAMRKLTNLVAKHKVLVIFINQLREKVGGYGNPETTPGGRALKFYASVRLDVRKGEFVKVGTDIIGHATTVKVIKNKVAAPHKVATFSVLYNEGVDFAQEVYDLGHDLFVVQKSGSWMTFIDPTTGQPELNGADNKPYKVNGTAQLREEFKRNPTLKQLLFDRMQASFASRMSNVPMIDEDEIPEGSATDIDIEIVTGNETGQLMESPEIQQLNPPTHVPPMEDWPIPEPVRG